MGVQLTDICPICDLEADRVPEASPRAHLKKMWFAVVDGAADGAHSFRRCENSLLQKRAARLNPGLGEEPGEEFYLCRGVVLPDVSRGSVERSIQAAEVHSL
jgi:hypothetical protein